jgi:PIN domain nuclease of toxin-antitoxin system
VNAPLLIDTCALIWLAGTAEVRHLGPVEDALDQARAEKQAVYVSPITAWEIGLLVSKRRLPIALAARTWLQRIMTVAGLSWASMPVEVLLAASDLPDNVHKDPADRIIMATAREYGLRLVTRDRAILAYAGKGHLLALPC